MNKSLKRQEVVATTTEVHKNIPRHDFGNASRPGWRWWWWRQGTSYSEKHFNGKYSDSVPLHLPAILEEFT